MRSLSQLLVRWAILAVGVMLATHLVSGISYDKPSTVVVVVLLLSFFNAILKPLLVLFTFPFIVLTLGLGVVVINALLFLFVGRLVEGFSVDGFWPAVGGAIIVSLTNMIFGGLTRRPPPPGSSSQNSSRPARSVRDKNDDVIDI